MASRGWQGVTSAEIAKMGRGSRQAVPEKPSKYRNVKVEIDGHKFDSKREAAIYQELKLREKAGEIRNLRLQVPFDLMTPDVHTGAYVNVATYIADFTYEEYNGMNASYVNGWSPIRVADCKGGRNTQMFTLKKKWLFLQSGIEIREIR